MRRDVDGEPVDVNPFGGERSRSRFDRGARTREDDLFRRVDRRDGQSLALQPGPRITFRHADDQHRSWRQRLEQARAQQHDGKGVVERKHASRARGSIFTEAVADERRRLDPPRAP